MKFLYEPVAVRYKKVFFLLYAAKRGQAIENSLEKAKKVSAAVGIFFGQVLFECVASADPKKRKNKIFFRRMQIMKKTKVLKLLSCVLCVVLIAAMALITGCNDNQTPDTVSSAVTDTVSKAQVTTIGEGDTQFDFTVVDKDEKETKFLVSTNKTTVGEALLDAGLIKGEDSEYGLYVKTVNGITLDFNIDGMYWAFYVNDEYSIKGVDAIEIKSGEIYSFKASK